jgi:glycerophosphoryl diester phosphodiesterase
MLDRTTTGHGPVRERSLVDLKKLDAGISFGEASSGEQIPTLEEVLDGLGPLSGG